MSHGKYSQGDTLFSPGLRSPMELLDVLSSSYAPNLISFAWTFLVRHSAGSETEYLLF